MLNRSADTRDSATVSETNAMALSAGFSSPATDGGRCAVAEADMPTPQLLEAEEPPPPPPPPPLPPPQRRAPIMPVVLSARTLPSR